MPLPSLFIGHTINVTDVYVWTWYINNRKGCEMRRKRTGHGKTIQAPGQKCKNTFKMEYPPECQLDGGYETETTLITGVVLSSRLHAVFVF